MSSPPSGRRTRSGRDYGQPPNQPSSQPLTYRDVLVNGPETTQDISREVAPGVVLQDSVQVIHQGEAPVLQQVAVRETSRGNNTLVNQDEAPEQQQVTIPRARPEATPVMSLEGVVTQPVQPVESVPLYMPSRVRAQVSNIVEELWSRNLATPVLSEWTRSEWPGEDVELLGLDWFPVRGRRPVSNASSVPKFQPWDMKEPVLQFWARLRPTLSMLRWSNISIIDHMVALWLPEEVRAAVELKRMETPRCKLDQLGYVLEGEDENSAGRWCTSITAFLQYLQKTFQPVGDVEERMRTFWKLKQRSGESAYLFWLRLKREKLSLQQLSANFKVDPLQLRIHWEDNLISLQFKKQFRQLQTGVIVSTGKRVDENDLPMICSRIEEAIRKEKEGKPPPRAGGRYPYLKSTGVNSVVEHKSVPTPLTAYLLKRYGPNRFDSMDNRDKDKLLKKRPIHCLRCYEEGHRATQCQKYETSRRTPQGTGANAIQSGPPSVPDNEVIELDEQMLFQGEGGMADLQKNM